MKGFREIGNTYLLYDNDKDIYLLWAIVENNSNAQTTTLEVVEGGQDIGRRMTVPATWINKQYEFGLLIEPDGEIVIENGIEYVKPALEKIQSKTL